MKIVSRVGLGLALLAVLAVGAITVPRKCAGGWAFGGGQEGGRFSIQMLPGDEDADRRFDAKAEIADRLCDRRLTLLEAANLFQTLNRTQEECGYDSLAAVTGGSRGEKVCRQVIRWARAAGERRSASEGEAVERRLEAELRAYLDRDDTVELPAQ